MRVVIGEDQALLREGVVRLLVDAGFEVVAEAADAPDLVRKVGAHKPDVAIIDVQMPPDNTDDGLRAALEIRAHQPGVGVLVLSQFAESPATRPAPDTELHRQRGVLSRALGRVLVEWTGPARRAGGVRRPDHGTRYAPKNGCWSPGLRGSSRSHWRSRR